MREFSESIRIDGLSYSRKKLLDFCATQLNDPGTPAWKREVLSFIALFLDPAGGSITQLSSGTTGDPKLFTLSRDAMTLSARRTLRFFKLKPGERALLSLPVNYIAGKMMVVRALVGGLDLLLCEPSSRPVQGLSGDISFAAFVPLQIEESLQQGDPLERISKLLIGGGELHPATRGKLASLVRPEIYESFGMTETYTHFALRRINGSGPDSSFRLLEGVQIGRDRRGCLKVDVPGITSGPLNTNDLVEISPGGDGFTWLGRYDNLINSGGIKIIPEELEKQVGKFLGLECLVLSEPDRKLGNRLVLVVEFEGSSPPLDKWLDLLRRGLSSHELPRRIITTHSLPRNASMKPDRTSARDLLL